MRREGGKDGGFVRGFVRDMDTGLVDYEFGNVWMGGMGVDGTMCELYVPNGTKWNR